MTSKELIVPNKLIEMVSLRYLQRTTLHTHYFQYNFYIMTALLILLQAAALGKMGAALGASIAVVGASMGIGRIGVAAMEAIARQPEAAGDIRSNMIVAAALIEGVAFFAVVVCLLILFI